MLDPGNLQEKEAYTIHGPPPPDTIRPVMEREARESAPAHAAARLLEPVDSVPDDHNAPRNHCAGRCSCTGRDQQGRTTFIVASAQRSDLDRLKVHVLGRDLTVSIVDGSRPGHVDAGLQCEQRDRREPMSGFELGQGICLGHDVRRKTGLNGVVKPQAFHRPRRLDDRHE
jgi:hypothetical protein